METTTTMTAMEFNSQVSRLNSLLFGFAKRLTGNQENAKDLMQETMIRAYASRHNFTEASNFKAWVTTIMRNCFINDYRKKVTRNKVEQSFQITPAVSQSVRNLAPTTLMMKELRNMLDDLSEGNRIPFELFFNGYEYLEIAERLELPMGTVKSRIFCARKKLKEMIHENYGEHVRYA